MATNGAGTIVRVAVIGSGLAGLTAAALVSSSDISFDRDVKFECHLFEKEEQVGMDASSITVQDTNSYVASRKTEGGYRIDVPMRSFQGGYYTELFKLYARLGVELKQADFSYSYSSLFKRTGTILTQTIYNGRSGRAGIGIPSCVLQNISPREKVTGGLSLTMLKAYFIFMLSVLELLANFIRLVIHSSPFLRPVGTLTFQEWAINSQPNSTLARWLGLQSSWERFVETILIPTFSAVCTAPREDVLEHPVEELLEYVWLTLFTHHYKVKRGVCDVVEKLSAKIHKIHLSSPITDLLIDPGRHGLLRVVTRRRKRLIDHGRFSHVVFATQANVASQILRSCTSLESTSKIPSLIKCLEEFKYRKSLVVNHTDETPLPDTKSDWRELNLVSALSNEECSNGAAIAENTLCDSYTMTTHILQPHSSGNSILQTTNPIIAINSSKVLSRSEFTRAVLTVGSKKALAGLCKTSRSRWNIAGRTTTSLGDLQGLRLHGAYIWLCGSYASDGIPLLEGCLKSARTVIEQGVLTIEGARFNNPPW